ncbi:hypothetical protein PV10_01169 [Exophiala mesophila]|uniref:ATP synthase subunit g, mitochondrial n=1 Tax=Exophiala mesophila TaxID=212818 RepID=A0A0D1ZU07_EXOME|nr:uncharacterized protein PV10_01169 [Exophiala mesophila]KIV97414.1 hypothetical protein PV10_01169 [Exophiala mesophila]
MSSTRATRILLRQSNLVVRRNAFRQASTASEAAGKAQESGQKAISKATEGLSRVTSSAGSAISKAGSALGKVGGRTGRFIAFVESLIPPTVYYSRVALELSKMVARGQQWAPPSLAQFQSYFQPLTNIVRNPRSISSATSSLTNSVNPQQALSTVRNASGRQVATVGLVAAEILGFFTVGEMIGRFKVVGYHGEPAHEH